MLVHLHVKNLALIEEVEVDFGPGLNILTGETGAGKSIILGSMQLILGSKPSREMIREGAPYGLVELLFQVGNTKAEEALQAMEIEMPEGEVLLSRKIMDGRSVCKINGETCTVGQLKTAAALLLDIHGQHEHQSLLNTDRQLEILDEFGRDAVEQTLNEVQDAYRSYRKAHQELISMDMDEEKRNREIAFLEFEIQEIESAALQDGEDELLENRYRKMMNGQKIVQSLLLIQGWIGGETGASDQTGRSVMEMERIIAYDEQLRSLGEALGEIDGLMADFSRELSGYLDDMNFDEELFQETEKRLDLINTLKSKYGQSIEDIRSYCLKQKQKLSELQSYEEHLEKAKQHAARARKDLLLTSEELSEKRKGLAVELEKKIIEGLQEMNFLDVRFEISFSRRKSFSERGIDEIEYRISTNPGESIHAMGKIVSGGELSRIMLAIKAILADKDQIDTLIFDEIDTGISGITAQKVADKLAGISGHRQVLCITHLPQIASMADDHFGIEKHGDSSGTQTQIHPLEELDSMRELARLLGGDPMTEAALENAREMKRTSQSRKMSIRS